jgi:hypothetical protein
MHLSKRHLYLGRSFGRQARKCCSVVLQYTFWVPPLLSGAHPFTPSLISAVLIMALVVVVYKVFGRSLPVEDPERFAHPKLDGTWRDWVR